MSPFVPRLLLITPALPVQVLIRRVKMALATPEVTVLLRQPDASDAQLVNLAIALRELTREAGARLLISRRPDVAALVGADGVHLPESGLAVEDARRLLPTGSLVGCSRHDARGLENAAAQGADYATLSPVFEVPGKGAPLGLPGFCALAVATNLPVLALGGVDASHMGELRRGGAHGVAVTRAGLGAEDVAEAMQKLCLTLGA